MIKYNIIIIIDCKRNYKSIDLSYFKYMNIENDYYW